MNRFQSKSVQKLDNKFEPSIIKKRKREEEPFQRIVIPKLTSNYNLESKEFPINKLTMPILSIISFITHHINYIRASNKSFINNYK